MRNVTSREELDTDEYFKELYAGYTKEQLDNVYRCINDSTSVIERPKMIHNEKTGQYLLWFQGLSRRKCIINHLFFQPFKRFF